MNRMNLIHFLTEESNKTDSTYKTESETCYAEIYKPKKYRLTLYELDNIETDSKLYEYDEDNSLEDRL